MKKLIITAASILIVLACHAQTRVTKDSKGNYVVVKRIDTTTNKPTGHTLTDKDGKVYPLFISSRGKLFYMRTSRNGNVYKCYVKEA